MKVLILLTFIVSQLIFVSCENIPRGRPSIAEEESKITANDDSESTVDQADERPSGAVIVQSDHCGCSQAKAITLGDCELTCSESQAANDQTDKLFFNVELTEIITLGVYQDLFGWCNQEIKDADGNPITGTGCYIEVKDEKGQIQSIPFTPSSNTLSFNIDIGALNDDTTYRLTIVEQTSGARSTTFQVRKFSELIEDKVSGPLQLMPVNRYTCMIREFQVEENSGSTVLTDINRFHLFFNSETRPEPLQEATVSSFFCHDIETYGTTPINSPLLEESAGVFSTWYKNDPRFFDLDSNGVMDINQLIEQEVILQGTTLSQTPNLFSELQWMSGLDDGNQSPNNDETTSLVQVINSSLGFYMSPFLDDDTFKAYCPTQEHYYSSSPLFKAMREVVAVDTEGLYIAKEDNVCNFLLINESLLKQIWFYIEGGQHIEPTSDTVAGKQVQFYWPADTSSPFIKKSHQRIYTIKAAEDLNNVCSSTVSSTSANDSGGLRTNFPPHDKRIGCIPVLQN